MKIFKAFLLLYPLVIYCQVPNNLVPNGTFEYPYNYTGCKNIFRLDSWYQSNNYSQHGSPDWISHYNYNSGGCFFVPCQLNALDGDKYVFLGKDPLVPNGEAIFNTLTNQLELGKRYKLRIWANGRPGDYFAVHLLNDPDNWSGGMFNQILGSIPLNSNGCIGFVFESDFEASKNDLDVIAIKSLGGLDGRCYLYIDNIELYEYCSETLVRQARYYKHHSELEEANNIVAGSVYNGIAGGDVNMMEGSLTMYKAKTEITLVEGFIANRGADFTAKIAPCGKSCSSPDINIPTDYYLCDESCIQVIGHSASYGMTAVWSSMDVSNLEYLSSINTLKPLFCPPAGVNGTFSYTLTISNSCGESVTKTIRFHKETQSNPFPNHEIVLSNLSLNPDHPELKIAVSAYTERLIVEVMDCFGNVLKANEYKGGVDFTSPAAIDWSLPDFFHPCGCYKIRIRSKNFCFPQWKETILDWNRIVSPINTILPTAALCINGKRWICFNASGVNLLHIQLFDRDENKILDKTISYSGNNLFCYQLPDDLSVTWGTYFMIVKFIGCDGSVVDEHTTIYFGPCEDGIVEPDDGWDGDVFSSNIYLRDGDNNIVDSLHSSISPNPIINTSLINYHLPQAGLVKITAMNSNFEVQAVLLHQDNKPPGDYQIELSKEGLNYGVNYYMIEFFGLNGSSVSRIIQRIFVQ